MVAMFTIELKSAEDKQDFTDHYCQAYLYNASEDDDKRPEEIAEARWQFAVKSHLLELNSKINDFRAARAQEVARAGVQKSTIEVKNEI